MPKRAEREESTVSHMHRETDMPSFLVIGLEERMGDGRYGAGEYLGRGATSEVFQGWDHDKSMDCECAIKVYFNPKMSDEYLAGIAAEEIDRMRGFDHPHIVRAYDDFEVPSKLNGHMTRALVMELCERSLTKWGPDGPHSETEVLRIFQHCMSALDYLSQKHSIHCDIKPDNIMLMSDGVAKLTDFGTAVDIAFTDDAVSVDRGSRGWEPPEKHRSVKSDVYTLTRAILASSGGWSPGLPIDPCVEQGLSIVSPSMQALFRKAMSGKTDTAAQRRPPPGDIYKAVTKRLNELDLEATRADRIAVKRKEIEEKRIVAEAERLVAAEEREAAAQDRRLARSQKWQAFKDRMDEKDRQDKEAAAERKRQRNEAKAERSKKREEEASQRRAAKDDRAKKREKSDKPTGEASSDRDQAVAQRRATWRKNHPSWQEGLVAWWCLLLLISTLVAFHLGGPWSTSVERRKLGAIRVGAPVAIIFLCFVTSLLLSIPKKPSVFARLKTQPVSDILNLIVAVLIGAYLGVFILGPSVKITAFGATLNPPVTVSPWAWKPSDANDPKSFDDPIAPTPTKQTEPAGHDLAMPTISDIPSVGVIMTQSQNAYIVTMNVRLHAGVQSFTASPQWMISHLGIWSATRPDGPQTGYEDRTGGPHQLANGTWVTPPIPPGEVIHSSDSHVYDTSQGDCGLWNGQDGEVAKTVVPKGGFFPDSTSSCVITFLLPRSIGYAKGSAKNNYNAIGADDLKLVILNDDRTQIDSSKTPSPGIVWG